MLSGIKILLSIDVYCILCGEGIWPLILAGAATVRVCMWVWYAECMKLAAVSLAWTSKIKTNICPNWSQYHESTQHRVMSHNSARLVTLSYVRLVMLNISTDFIYSAMNIVWVRWVQTKLIRQTVGLEAAVALFSNYVATIYYVVT